MLSQLTDDYLDAANEAMAYEIMNVVTLDSNEMTEWSRSKSKIKEYALLSLFLWQRNFNEHIDHVLHPEYGSIYDEGGWSMKTDRVMENVNQFTDEHYVDLEDAYPISWHRSDRIDVIETIIEGCC